MRMVAEGGFGPLSLSERCLIHSRKMDEEGWYVTSNVLWLASEALSGRGAMPVTGEDLQHFLDERHMSRKDLGAALEISQDRLRRFLSGVQPIPRHISLACAAMAYGLPPWP